MIWQPDILRPASPDEQYLCASIQESFLDLCGAYLRLRGVQLTIPTDLQLDVRRWREFAGRLMTNNPRIKESEWQAMKAVAQWTVDVNKELRGQGPVVVEFDH